MERFREFKTNVKHRLDVQRAKYYVKHVESTKAEYAAGSVRQVPPEEQVPFAMREAVRDAIHGETDYALGFAQVAELSDAAKAHLMYVQNKHITMTSGNPEQVVQRAEHQADIFREVRDTLAGVEHPTSVTAPSPNEVVLDRDEEVYLPCAAGDD